MTSFQPQARALLANHYLIIPIHPGQKRPQGDAWQNARVSSLDVPRLWANGSGIGVLCGVGALPVYAIDIDVYDEALAQALERWCEVHIEPTVVRVGRHPKRLLLYQGREAGVRKRVSRVWSGAGAENRVEVLGLGQQFVACGIHPDTKSEYQWIDPWGGVCDVRADELPILRDEDVSGVIAEFERLAQGAGWTRKGGGDSAPVLATVGGGSAPNRVVAARAIPTKGEHQTDNTPAAKNEGEDLLLVSTSLGRSIEQIKATLALLDPDMQREDWIRVLAALKHEVTAMPVDGWEGLGVSASGVERVAREREGYAAGLDWSARGAKFAGSSDVHGRWVSFKRGDVGDAPLVTWSWAETLAGGDGVVEATGGLVAPVRPKRPRTEMGNAERLLDRFGDGLMYVPELKRWYLWTGVYWRKAMDVEVEHLAKSTILGLREEVDLWGEDEREAFFKFCAQSQKAQMVGNMVRLSSSDPRVVVPASELDKDWWALGVRNGVVDLRSGLCAAPNAERRVTLTCGCDYIEGACNELWESTVSDVFNDDVEMVSFFQRLVGYSLLGRPDEDVLVIPWGSGSNGKSTLMGVLAKVFGDYARVGAAETFLASGAGGPANNGGGPRPDLLAMRGARLVWVGEPDQGAELREGFVKSATGGDPITARAMHSNDIITITPSWVLWMPTNHKPIVRGDDWAIWRRLMLVPFTRNFDSDPFVIKDGGRDKRLAENDRLLAGILNWCIEGAKAYLEGGLNRPKAVDAARDAYRQDMDLLAEWLGECCETHPDARESSAQLWASWEMFARARGELRMIPSQRSLTRRLEARGFNYMVHSIAKNVRGFAGLAVRIAENLG